MTFHQPLSSVFNLGEYRRRVTQMYKNHNFFRSDNEEAMALRQRCALDALEDVCEWLEDEAGEVAVSAFRTTIVLCWKYNAADFIISSLMFSLIPFNIVSQSINQLIGAYAVGCDASPTMTPNPGVPLATSPCLAHRAG